MNYALFEIELLKKIILISKKSVLRLFQMVPNQTE